jgi:hypothetical protein
MDSQNAIDELKIKALSLCKNNVYRFIIVRNLVFSFSNFAITIYSFPSFFNLTSPNLI